MLWMVHSPQAVHTPSRWRVSAPRQEMVSEAATRHRQWSSAQSSSCLWYVLPFRSRHPEQQFRHCRPTHSTKQAHYPSDPHLIFYSSLHLSFYAYTQSFSFYFIYSQSSPSLLSPWSRWRYFSVPEVCSPSTALCKWKLWCPSQDQRISSACQSRISRSKPQLLKMRPFPAKCKESNSVWKMGQLQEHSGEPETNILYSCCLR